MSIFNGALRLLFDGLLFPFRGLPAWVGLTLISLAAGVGMLLVYRATSNQQGLAAVKRQIHACLFEIRLFNDDLRAILRAQLEILRHNLTYLRLSLAPLAWVIVPFFLVVAQLQFHYGYAGLEPGRPTLVEVTLRADGEAGSDASRPQAALEAPPGLRVETAPVWIPSERQLAWRIVGERPGSYELIVRVDGESVAKSVEVSDRVVRRSPIRVSGFWWQLVYPAERPLPAAGAIESIEVAYPPIELWGAPRWIWIFLALSIVFAFALRKRLGVTL